MVIPKLLTLDADRLSDLWQCSSQRNPLRRSVSGGQDILKLKHDMTIFVSILRYLNLVLSKSKLYISREIGAGTLYGL